jgi:hypothetical protein
MAAKRTRERCRIPGVGVAHDTGKHSTAAAGVAARATFPQGRAGCDPFSPGPPPDENGVTDSPDLQQTLYVLIVQQWAQTLTGPYDWANWPLDRYVFSDAFLGELEHQADMDSLAFVCAMVACGLTHEFPELRLGSLHESDRLEDGALRQRCSIEVGRGAGSHLDFWRLPSGVIEFDRFTALRLVHNADADTGTKPAAC